MMGFFEDFLFVLNAHPEIGISRFCLSAVLCMLQTDFSRYFDDSRVCAVQNGIVVANFIRVDLAALECHVPLILNTHYSEMRCSDQPE